MSRTKRAKPPAALKIMNVSSCVSRTTYDEYFSFTQEPPEAWKEILLCKKRWIRRFLNVEIKHAFEMIDEINEACAWKESADSFDSWLVNEFGLTAAQYQTAKASLLSAEDLI